MRQYFAFRVVNSSSSALWVLATDGQLFGPYDLFVCNQTHASLFTYINDGQPEGDDYYVDLPLCDFTEDTERYAEPLTLMLDRLGWANYELFLPHTDNTYFAQTDG